MEAVQPTVNSNIVTSIIVAILLAFLSLFSFAYSLKNTGKISMIDSFAIGATSLIMFLISLGYLYSNYMIYGKYKGWNATFYITLLVTMIGTVLLGSI